MFTPTQDQLKKLGSHCWRLSVADRGRFLIDGAAYFNELSQALSLAKDQLFIFGWDFVDNVPLQEGHSQNFRDLLFAQLERSLDLRIYIAVWDSYPFFQSSRTPIKELKERLDHPRIHFVGNRQVPTFGSFHQKLVVIDDSIAFCGGIDITAHRFDTPSHRPKQSANDEHGRFIPIHDIHCRVEGRAAQDLGDLARLQWEMITDESLSPARKEGESLECKDRLCFDELKVGIARTYPEHKDHKAVNEIEAALTELLLRAETLIYVEAQYLSAPGITEILCQQLRKPAGPEVIIVSSKEHFGPWEDATLGTLRSQQLGKLHEANLHNRLGVFYPYVNRDLLVHSKLVIVDDRYAMLGSANLTNRSLGLDYECSLIFMADERQNTIYDLKLQLLSEHLNMEVAEVHQKLRQNPSHLELVHTCEKEERCLRPLAMSEETWWQHLLSKRKWADPHEGLKPPWKKIKAFGSLFFFGVVGWFLYARIQTIQWAEVTDALGQYSFLSLGAAFLLALLGYSFYSSFDLLGRNYIRHALSVPRSFLIAFASYGFNLNLGAIVGGAAFRYRLYSQFGLNGLQISKIFSFSIFTNWMGYTFLMSLCLLGGSAMLAPVLGLSTPATLGLGTAGIALVASYLGLSFFKPGKNIKIKKFDLKVPSLPLAALQLALASGNWLMMGITMSVFMPAEIGFFTTLFSVMGASVVGIVIRVPGGLGVQEAAFLTILGSRLPASEALAAFFAYRGAYYFLPLVLCLGTYFFLEAKAPKK